MRQYFPKNNNRRAAFIREIIVPISTLHNIISADFQKKKKLSENGKKIEISAFSSQSDFVVVVVLVND